MGHQVSLRFFALLNILLIIYHLWPYRMKILVYSLGYHELDICHQTSQLRNPNLIHCKMENWSEFRKGTLELTKIGAFAKFDLCQTRRESQSRVPKQSRNRQSPGRSQGSVKFDQCISPYCTITS